MKIVIRTTFLTIVSLVVPSLAAASGFGVFTQGALGVIAYLIGGSISVAHLKRVGSIIAGAILGETLGVMLCVGGAFWAALYWLGHPQAGILPLPAVERLLRYFTRLPLF